MMIINIHQYQLWFIEYQEERKIITCFVLGLYLCAQKHWKEALLNHYSFDDLRW